MVQNTNVAVAQMPLKVIVALGQISGLVKMCSAALLWLYNYTISVLELVWQYVIKLNTDSIGHTNESQTSLKVIDRQQAQTVV